MTTSSYDELVERCERVMLNASSGRLGMCRAAIRYLEVSAILAEVLRTLEKVTPEMDRAWHESPETESGPLRDWLIMLRASPLIPSL